MVNINNNNKFKESVKKKKKLEFRGEMGKLF